MDLNDLNEFDYDLPEHLIALEPVAPRSSSKLLVYSQGKILDTRFQFLFKYLKPKDRLIFNDTKVLNAKLLAKRIRQTSSGTVTSKIEILLTERISGTRWTAYCKPLKKLRILDQIFISNSLNAQVIEKSDNQCILQFSKGGASLDHEISVLGQLPLPPYITKSRRYTESDKVNYQSIFARHAGAIASPTASLHFERDLILKLNTLGIKHSFVTLHVGAGTFLPVKSENISTHEMHAEIGCLSKKAASEINKTKAEGGRIIAVGTTSLRLIESAAISKNVVGDFNGKTNIFIKPGFDFKVSDGLITNFHFPKSTLLILIAAFVGNNERKRIYNHALKNKYRFFSYGDSSLLLPKT